MLWQPYRSAADNRAEAGLLCCALLGYLLAVGASVAVATASSRGGPGPEQVVVCAVPARGRSASAPELSHACVCAQLATAVAAVQLGGTLVVLAVLASRFVPDAAARAREWWQTRGRRRPQSQASIPLADASAGSSSGDVDLGRAWALNS